MSKTSISSRINNDIVRWLDSKTAKGKTRSDVLNEILAVAKLNDQNQDQIKQQKTHAELLAKGAKASIMLLKMAELALKKHSDQANEILNKTQAHYQDEIGEIKTLISQAQPEAI